MTRFITSLLFLALTMTGSVLSAQDDSKYGDTPEQQAACKENLSLYETYYKQKNYDDAYLFWQNACEVCLLKVSRTCTSGESNFSSPNEGRIKGES